MTPFPTHGTGEGLKKGDKDPHWDLTTVANDPVWQPSPAVACDLLGFYDPNDQRSEWISIQGKLIDIDAGPYTFRTTFDLSGFIPSSAHLRLNVAADDNITEIRLNGLVIRSPQLAHGQLYRVMHPIDISSGFVAGINRLEIVVYNQTFSKMALKAELDGTAVREVDSQ